MEWVLQWDGAKEELDEAISKMGEMLKKRDSLKHERLRCQIEDLSGFWLSFGSIIELL